MYFYVEIDVFLNKIQ